MADVPVSNIFIFSNNVKYVKSSVRMGTAVKVMMRLGNDACLYGIMVKVLQFLEEDPQSRLPAHGRGGHGVKIRLLDFGTVDGSE